MFSDSIVLTALITLVLLGILVAVHEAGHFFVARWCGVKVLRFSVGFGKAIWRRIGKDGTEYVIAILPLGGYVRMLDSRVDTVPEAHLSQAFDSQNVYKRIAIVAAGPVINLLFAVFLYSGIQWVGVPQLVPVIAQPVAGSVAEAAGMSQGERILAIDGNDVHSWKDIHWQLVERAGMTGDITVTSQALDMQRLSAPMPLQSTSQYHNTATPQGQPLPTIGLPKEYRLPIGQWLLDDTDTSLMQQIGWQVWQPSVPVYIGQLVKTGAAAAAGLKIDDLITAINHTATPDYTSFVTQVHAFPDQTVSIEFQREGITYQRAITLQSKVTPQGTRLGLIGIGIRPWDWPKNMVQDTNMGAVAAVTNGAAQTFQMIRLTLSFIKRLIVGQIPVEHLSGPISIAQVAATSASMGWMAFFAFMAYLSVSLGVLNLLPIPMLDGGHLLYYFIELCTGKKVPDRIQAAGFRVGMMLVFGVMTIAIFNDFSRL